MPVWKNLYVSFRFQLLYLSLCLVGMATQNLQPKEGKRKFAKYVLYTNYLHSSLGIHLLHHRLFPRRLSSSMLSFNVFKIFRCSLRIEAKAFLSTFAFFFGSISCTTIRIYIWEAPWKNQPFQTSFQFPYRKMNIKKKRAIFINRLWAPEAELQWTRHPARFLILPLAESPN